MFSIIDNTGPAVSPYDVIKQLIRSAGSGERADQLIAGRNRSDPRRPSPAHATADVVLYHSLQLIILICIWKWFNLTENG